MPIQREEQQGWNGAWRVRRIGYKNREQIIKTGLTTTEADEVATTLDDLNTAFAKGQVHTTMFVIEPDRLAVSG